MTLNEVHGDDLWSVITPADALERRDGSNDLERSKAPKDHHCVCVGGGTLAVIREEGPMKSHQREEHGHPTTTRQSGAPGLDVGDLGV